MPFSPGSIPPEVHEHIARAAEALGAAQTRQDRHNSRALLAEITKHNPRVAALLEEYAVNYTRWYHEKCLELGSHTEKQLRKLRDESLQAVHDELTRHGSSAKSRRRSKWPWFRRNR